MFNKFRYALDLKSTECIFDILLTSQIRYKNIFISFVSIIYKFMIKYSIYFLTTFLILSCNEKKTCNCDIIYKKTIDTRETSFPSTEAIKIRYLSDGLEITGYIVKPKDLGELEKLPLIIYNRGGNRDFGATTKYGLRYLKYLASKGYIIMASEYRGNSFSEGYDEFGGEDINDVICLIKMSSKIDYIDEANIGLLGYSRGGLMNYLISKETDDIKTIVNVGAPTDLFLSSKNREDLYENVFKQLIGDTISKRRQFVERSALYWVKNLNEHSLILHGTSDKKVNIEHSLRLIDSLNKYQNSNVQSFFIENGNHSISNYRKVRNDTIQKWFDFYLK